MKSGIKPNLGLNYKVSSNIRIFANYSESYFVNQTDNTDQNADSTGCGMAFLSWLMSQGYGLDKITPEMVALGESRLVELLLMLPP